MANNKNKKKKRKPKGLVAALARGGSPRLKPSEQKNPGQAPRGGTRAASKAIRRGFNGRRKRK